MSSSVRSAVTADHDASLVSGSFDIGSAQDQQRVRSLADSLLASRPTIAMLVASARQPEVPIDLALAFKLAQSKLVIRSSAWSGQLAVVFAMWGEQRRLRPRSAANPTGEDALAVKLDQLEWLFGRGRNADADSGVGWKLIAVDDGDPDDSAAVARDRADDHRLGDRVTVLRLGDVVPVATGPLAGLAHVDDSRKGGAVVMGAARSLELGADAVVVTDADNSVNLAQLGLLIGPFVAANAGAVIGDRKHVDSVLVKAEARWGPGIVVLRHMQRMVGRALFDHGLRDTQAAFKLYGRAALQSILAAPSTYGFSFDSDWLYATAAAGLPIERAPFAFIDSFEESASITQGPMTTWESLLVGLVAAARERGADHDEEMAAVVDDFATAEILEQVVATVPRALAGASDAELGQRATMAPASLRSWLERLVVQ